ncbi:MAG: hypothetical protein KME21_29910 [Desmonostoc vinosum HA7617-LM4]|jgi:hypothetical protein|nr:hypothetical protein [Desmonostoc vinosum HA7617-LM4]
MSDRTFGHNKVSTSTFSNPSLVSSTIPTLANPTRGFGSPTNEESTNLEEEMQSADEQSLLSEPIQQRSFGHDISRIALRRPQTVGEHQKPIQRAATNLVQRDKTSDQLKDLETRTKLLEKKTAATQLDLKYRALFGEKTSNYKQIVYRLTGAFQSALSGYQGAHGKQAARDAVIDQIAATLVVVAGAAVLEPFLTSGLGKLQQRLGKISQTIAEVNIAKAVEKLENPLNAAASGSGNIATTSAAGDRATNAPQPPGFPAGTGGGTGGGDPLSFLTSNMEAIETHNQKLEAAFSNRATQYDAMTPEQWEKWSKETQEASYSTLLKDLDTVALGDIGKLEGAPTLAAKIELYMWAAWIKTQIVPGVKGLQLGGPLAKRLKELGVESLANVRFDTESWIFMAHEPRGKWESNLHNWALGWSQPLTK